MRYDKPPLSISQQIATIPVLFNPDRHYRRSIRLKNYDYSRPGAYFITIVTWQRECLFGEVTNKSVELSASGEAVQSAWSELSNRFTGVELDEFVVMPNHVHGIIVFVGALLAAPGPAPSRFQALGNVMRAFKSISAIQVNRLMKRSGRPLWQRNYYEHIIRNENELDCIRTYISENQAKWFEDPENPAVDGRPDTKYTPPNDHYRDIRKGVVRVGAPLAVPDLDGSPPGLDGTEKERQEQRARQAAPLHEANFLLDSLDGC